jgi:hypothetical protein
MVMLYGRNMWLQYKVPELIVPTVFIYLLTDLTIHNGMCDYKK